MGGGDSNVFRQIIMTYKQQQIHTLLLCQFNKLTNVLVSLSTKDMCTYYPSKVVMCGSAYELHLFPFQPSLSSTIFICKC